jgi:metal-dependent amidase/aminoacylase/carboxypeptidase family protein
MSSKDELKRTVCEAIDRHADAIIDLGETILRNPETGFNEVKTAALVAERMSALGLAPGTGAAARLYRRARQSADLGAPARRSGHGGGA